MQNQEGKYIYGFIETDHVENFGAIGIGDCKNDVTTIHFRDIAAVVSDHPVIEFDSLDSQTLNQCVTTHQLVNEKVMQNYTMIPIKFGNIAKSEKEIKQILEQAYIQFKTILNRIKGKIELIVQASSDKQQWIQEIARSNERVIELTKKLDSLSEEEKLLTRIEIGRLIHESVSLKEKLYIDDILATLRNGGHNYAPGKLLTMQMIFNGSFLIDKKREQEFDQKVNALAEKHQNELTFRYIGPMPPGSFVNLRLGVSDFKLISNARKLLGLSEKATMMEIKAAYRQLASQYHPDKNINDSLAEIKFGEITEAYHLLETFCHNYRYSFKEEIIKETLLVHSAPVVQG